MGAAIPWIAGASILGGIASRPKKLQAPPPRSYLAEMQDALKSQGGIQSQLLGLENQYTPQYQDLQQQSLMGQLGVLNNVYGQIIPQSEQLQRQMMASQGGIYADMGQYSRNAYNASLDPSVRNLMGSMGVDAQAGLDAGMGLTPEMQQQAQQASRAAMGARGLTLGNQGVANEILNSYALGSARQDRARSYAGNVLGLAQTQAGQAYNQYASPMLNNMNAVTPANLYSQGVAGYSGLGAKLFNPESQYNAGVYGANQSNQMQTNLANYQAQQAFSSGLMSLGGNILGAQLMGANISSSLGGGGSGLNLLNAQSGNIGSQVSGMQNTASNFNNWSPY